MRFFGLSRRKKSSLLLPNALTSSASLCAPYPRQGQDVTLSLPTKLDDVVNSVHECVPQHLTGEKASQDDVRYFLYQILTLKDYNIARRSPQWVLETCMLWQGNGAKLRSLPLDAFQQLCPLRPGFAVIDWTVRGSKFRPQDLPPCGVRDEIGSRVRNIVEILRRKEEGHRGPGWRNVNQRLPTIKVPAAMDEEQRPAIPEHHGFQVPSFRPSPSYAAETPFYSLSNHSMPVFQQTSFQQTSPYMHRQASLTGSRYAPNASWPTQRVVSPEPRFHPTPSSELCGKDTPVPSPHSTISSHSQRGSLFSQDTNSSTQTSLIGLENKDQLWAPSSVQSIATARARGQMSYSEAFQNSPRQKLASRPSQYKSIQQQQPPLLPERSFQPTRHLAHLRLPSYDSSSAYASSETSLTPSDSATDKYDVRRDSAVPPDVPQQQMRGRTSDSPSIASSLFLSSIPKTSVTALPDLQSIGSFRPGTATPIVRGGTKLARPLNNYKVDAHALETAEIIGCKSRPSPVRSIMVAAERRHKLTGGQSTSGVNTHMDIVPTNPEAETVPVGPLLRFQNPRTGQPRLTIYETIEQQEMLGKQRFEHQRRVEMKRGRLKTVFETIEEQELLDGRPQRGMNTYASCEWSSYM